MSDRVYSENILMTSEKFQEERTYWFKKLEGSSMSGFATDFNRSSETYYKGKAINHKISDNNFRKIASISNNSENASYVILLSAVKCLESVYTGNDDIVVGMPLFKSKNNQDHFCKILPLRSQINHGMSFKEMLMEVKRTVTEADKNKNFPVNKVIQKLQLYQEDENAPAFKTIVLLENIHDSSLIDDSEADVVFAFWMNSETIEMNIQYNENLFRKEIIKRMASHFDSILERLLESPDVKLQDLEFVPEEEKNQILFEFNSTKAEYPSNMTIHELFEDQVRKVPENIAVVCNGAQLTYRELNERANRIALLLLKAGAERGSLVALIMEKSTDMIAGALGVLKAGGAYLPIDPSYPDERVFEILNDSKSNIILTNQRDFHDIILAQFQATGIETGDSHVILLNPEDGLDHLGENIENPTHVNEPDDLAYVIYTSGTTGRPKGAMIEHRNVVRLLINNKMKFDFSQSDVWTMFHSFCFDFSVWEIYGALLYGGKLVVVPKIIAQDPKEYLKLIENEGVTVLNQTPTAFYNLSEEEKKSDKRKLGIRYVIFGGEALKPAMLKYWNEKYPRTKLINMYGITETTVHVTYKEITDYEINNNVNSIGKPIPTLTVYIMNKNLKLLPIGVQGELCVGGDGVGRGYLNRTELTREKFVNNPYVDGEVLYRSGDLARLLPNGEIEYLGRIDHQVKIRGHRIELGEIEMHLLGYEAVNEAVVTDRIDISGNKYLCAFIVSEKEITDKEIRDYLSRYLPSYMMPSYFIQIPEIPMTQNGKVNKKALPDFKGKIKTGIEYEEPLSPSEKIAADIWQEVLKVGGVGVNDNFFNLGGDSIKAVSLISKMNIALKCKIEMKDLYTNPTIKELIDIISNSTGTGMNDYLKNGIIMIDEFKRSVLEEGSLQSKIFDNYEDFYPLSHIQQGMVFFSKLKPEEPIYHDQFVYVLEFNCFDENTFRNAVKILMKKHPMLRTTFYTGLYREAIQVVHKDLEPSIAVADISGMSTAEQENIVKEYMQKDLNNKFKFDNDILWRIGVFHISKSEFCVVISFHHAIIDGWSSSLFNSGLLDIYNELVMGKEYELNLAKSSYKDYVAINLARSVSEAVRDFWTKEFKGFTRTKLPFNLSRRKHNDNKGMKIFRRVFGKELLYGIEESAREYKCTVKDICLSAYIYLLSIITTDEDIVTGVVTHDRPILEDIEKVIGCFLNTIPIRIKVNEGISKLELLNSIKTYMTNVKANELFLEDIANIIGESSGNVGNPIFDTLFNYTDFHVYEDIQSKSVHRPSEYNLTLESEEMTNTLFDLEISKTLGDFAVQIKYSPNYFFESEIETAFNLYYRIIQSFCDKDKTVLEKDELLADAEQDRVIYELNSTKAEYASNKTIHKLFEEQVERTPGNTAIVCGERKITYRELNEKANQLAHFLIDRGVKPYHNIGLMMRRGIDMVIGMYGILKAGAAYVPIDPEYPEARKEYIARNSELSMVLADEDLDSGFEHSEIVKINHNELLKYSYENPSVFKDSHELAYVIYTSGSTGLPKGVMIEHHSAVNLISWVNKRYDVNEKDVLLFVTSVCFDLSVYDVLGTLASGAKIVIADKARIQDAKELKSLMEMERITFWDSVPTTMNYLVNDMEENCSDFKQYDLRLVFLSGDWIPVNLPGRIKKYFPNTKVISLGGATEGTVWSIYYQVETSIEYQTSIPYGKPIDNNYFYILDKEMRAVPFGVAGELYIGGVGVARGYINDVEKTKASFVKNRFLNAEGERMYKTGDYGRLLPDGNIEFLGRIDHQVKIRGYRVELGEIETQLIKYKSVKGAVVVDRTDNSGNKYICAFYISSEELAASEIRDFLSKELPEYMIPSYYAQIEEIPLSANGKVDRKALPAIGIDFDTETEYIAPESDYEVRLAKIWVEILGIDKVGVNNSFFELGGHSLKATALANRIHKEFNVEIPLRKIFSAQTIKEMASFIKDSKESIYSSIKPIEKKEYYPASSAQKRIYALSQMNSNSMNYNMPGAVVIEGSLNKERLEDIFNQIVMRHETLRTSFEVINGEIVQRIHKEAFINIVYYDVDGKEANNIINEFIKPFDLGAAPLIRICLIKIKQDSHILVYDMHHIISDGSSMGILVRDFLTLYDGKQLPELNVQYKDYAEWQYKFSNSDRMKDEEKFWMDVLSGEIPSLKLPTDFTRPTIQSFEGDRLEIILDKGVTAKLRKMAARRNSTLYMVLLAIYNILLSKLSSQEDILIGSVAAGRQHPDLDDLIGLFVNTVVMRNYPKSDMSFSDFLKEVKQNSLKAIENQDYQFDELVDKLSLKRNPGHNPVFDAGFAMQNTYVPDLNIEGLKISPYHFDFKVSKVDISLYATETDDQISIIFEYCTKLFREETLQRISQYFIKIVEEVTSEEDIKLGDIQVLDETLRNDIAGDINNTRIMIDRDFDF
ncbi:MAG TPA: amino acid adenylation domain-containing protein [Clostridia bacterium]|nr:amino acid adenylation domain-containing protein [Clostridia bacterium]